MLSNLHRTWIERNGGVVVGDGRIEVAPAVSYDGARGLEFAKGRRFAADQAVEEDFWVEATQTSARDTRSRGRDARSRGRGEAREDQVETFVVTFVVRMVVYPPAHLRRRRNLRRPRTSVSS